jgi:hypothetical protein
MNPNVTRWPNGFTNAVEGSMLGDLKTPRRTTYFEYFEDFAVFEPTEFVVTETQAGATQALAPGAGGLLLLTNTALAPDIVSLQFAGGTGAVRPLFLWEATKDLIFAARLSVDDALLATFAVGLAIADTSPIASLPANAMLVTKAAATNLPVGHVVSGGVDKAAPQVSSVGVVSAAMFEIGIQYCAANGIWNYFFNGTSLGTTRFAAPVTGPAALMAPTFAIGNGSAAARSMTIDWLYAAKER